MTPQERQVWRMAYAASYAHNRSATIAISLADQAVHDLRKATTGRANGMARDAMNAGDARRLA